MEAWRCLTDDTTTEIFFGGAAGGGKSLLGCFWVLSMCLTYPETRWLIGRAVLKTLKESTLLTLFGIFSKYNLKKDIDYRYNSMEGTIKFSNGSEIYLKDLFMYPSDPEFDELGSTEFTGAFIDEGSQITHKAYNILMSRIRYKLKEYNLKPKLLVCSNPTKNFLYSEFYKPYTTNTLPNYRKFIPALVGDNQYISKYYIENLHKLDKVSKERLLYGNFEYDDDPSKLFDYDKILDIFTNPIPVTKSPYYITCDIARFGSDKTVLIVWNGLKVLKIISYNGKDTEETAKQIVVLQAQYNVPRSNVVIDDDGIGGGVVDQLKGVKRFINNSKQIETGNTQYNFANLKSQCYFKLAEYINDGKISIPDASIEVKKLIIEDLEQIKWKDKDKDGRIQITPKEEIKEHLGRSPDFGDALMMRMFYELSSKYKPYIAI
jgi:hypothetical protein